MRPFDWSASLSFSSASFFSRAFFSAVVSSTSTSTSCPSTVTIFFDDLCADRGEAGSAAAALLSGAAAAGAASARRAAPGDLPRPCFFQRTCEKGGDGEGRAETVRAGRRG